MIVLGVSGAFADDQEDSVAALAVDGRIIAACEEERYTRIRSAKGHFPLHAIAACLKIGDLDFEEVDLIVSPGATFQDQADRVRAVFTHHYGSCMEVEVVEHQLAHAACAFYGSGLWESLVLALDGQGDGSSAILAHATREGGIHLLETWPARNSLGHFLSIMAQYLGFGVGRESNLSALAASGEPTVDLSGVIGPAANGWELDASFLRSSEPARGPDLISCSEKLARYLGVRSRAPRTPLTQFYRDVARSTQDIIELGLQTAVHTLRNKGPESRNLCYSGSVALNTLANRNLISEIGLDTVYISPVASDRGLAIGCAYLGAAMLGSGKWQLWDTFLGSQYSDVEIRGALTEFGCRFEVVVDPCGAAADLLGAGSLVGWYQGRSEAGARSLGNRSVLSSCLGPKMGQWARKFSEQDELADDPPLSLSILEESFKSWFASLGNGNSPWMTRAFSLRPERSEALAAMGGVNRMACVQTVGSSDNELYYELLRRYAKDSGIPVLYNANLQLPSQPLAETPRDAILTLYGTGLDALILGNCVIRKALT